MLTKVVLNKTNYKEKEEVQYKLYERNMNKLLVVSIDSNHPSDLCVDVVENLDEAVMTLLHRESNEGDGLTVTTSEDSGKIRITLSNGDPDDEYFVVAEAIEVPKNYTVVWWHAYDGVGFDFKGSSDDINEAQAALDFYVETYYDKKVLEGYTKGDRFVKAVFNNEDEYLYLIDLSKEGAA